MDTVTHGALRNVEFKARCDDHESIRRELARLGARRVGEDVQTDTYFHCRHGRLKLREGSIENALIFYRREDLAAARGSDVILHQASRGESLKELLSVALGVDVVVEKRREIFFLGNVKIHLDEVPLLGRFVEVEAIDEDGTNDPALLRGQCDRLQAAFGIESRDMEKRSYSDLIRERQGERPERPRS